MTVVVFAVKKLAVGPDYRCPWADLCANKTFLVCWLLDIVMNATLAGVMSPEPGTSNALVESAGELCRENREDSGKAIRVSYLNRDRT